MTELSSMSSSSNVSQSQILRDSHKVKLNFAYGDILGNTYVKSLERFTENMSDSIKDFVFEYIDAITEGGHSLAKATEYLMDENPDIIENFIPPSKKIKLNLSKEQIDNKSIVKKEEQSVETHNNNSNIINDDIPLQLTPYEVKQIENIINNIIIKKNYEYEQREIGMVESIIRDNHIDFLLVINREKISTIIKDIILKHSKANINVNNKLVSDKLIKDYIESNIIELKLYKEMKSNIYNRDLKKEAQLEYNIQKRFLEMLNISSNYGIDRINRENELQIKKLEQGLLYKSRFEQDNLKKQQELQRLEQQKLEKEKTKQKEQELKQQLEQQRIEYLKKQQKLKDRVDQLQKQSFIPELEQRFKQQRDQLLRQRLEQQKINANQPTQFDVKKDQSNNLKDQQEKFIMLKRQQLLKSLQMNDSKSPEALKNKMMLDKLKINQQQQQQQNTSQIKSTSQTSVSKIQDKISNSNFTNISFGNLLNNRKNANNVSMSNIMLDNVKFNSQQQLLLQQQQQLKNYMQTQQGRKSSTSQSILVNSKINSNTTPTTIAGSVNSLKVNSNNNNINSLLVNQRISPVSSSNIASILAAGQNNTNTSSSQDLSSLLSNTKSLLSDKVKSNLSNSQNKTDFPSSYISVSQSLPSTQAISNYSSLIASNPKLTSTSKTSSYSSLLSNDSKLKTRSNSTTATHTSNPKLPVTQSTPDFTSLLSSNPTIVSTSNLSSLLSSANTTNISKLTSSPPSLAVDNKNLPQKQKSTPINVPTTQVSLLSKSKTLPTNIDLSSLLSTTKFPTTTKASSIINNTKIPITQSLDSSLTSLLSNTNVNPSKTQSGSDLSSLNTNSKLSTNIPTTQSEPDFSSLLLSETKPQPAVSVPATQSVPDFSSLLDATIIPSTQSLNDLMSSKKVVATITQTSQSTISLSGIGNEQKVTSNPTVSSNLSSLLSTKLATTQPDSNVNSLLNSGKLATNDYSTLLGINVSNPPPTTKVSTGLTGPDFSMLLPNSGIGSSSIVSSSIPHYLLPAFNTSLPTSLPQQLSLLQNSNILSSLQTPSSQQNLTNSFLTNNSTSTTSKTTTNLKSNSKNPTSSFPSYFF